VPDVLIYADTVRSPELRHEIPLSVPDPFLYLERNGTRHAVVSSLELPRLRELEGLQVQTPDEYGQDELRRSGKGAREIRDILHVRICETLGVQAALVPGGFPVEVADNLRAHGIELTPDPEHFDRRRRAKNERELAGIRRAQKAAEAGMDAARGLLRKGTPISVEEIKAAIEEQFAAHDSTADEFIVSHGWQSAIGHHAGEGAIERSEPVVIDLFPRDRASGCYADMTRTFVIGEVPDELREWHRLSKEALDRAVSEIRPGVTGRSIFEGTCEIFEAAGYTTQRTKEEGKPLEEGFIHSLGHGVGLEVHEEPSLGMLGTDELVPGDVVSVEPGLYRPEFGGCRLEDLVLVTDDGCENLTDFSYELEP
jgi:Xaa-Pro aminopeptidase